MPVQENDVLDPTQAAAYLAVSKAYLYRLTHESRIPVIRLSRRCIRFRKSDLEAWLEAQRKPARVIGDGGGQ